jgi:hypothetical protein
MKQIEIPGNDGSGSTPAITRMAQGVFQSRAEHMIRASKAIAEFEMAFNRSK